MPLFRVTLSHSQDDLALSEPQSLDIHAESAAGALVIVLAKSGRALAIKHLRCHAQRLPDKGETAYEAPVNHGALCARSNTGQHGAHCSCGLETE